MRVLRFWIYALCLMLAVPCFAQETRRGFVDAVDCGRLTNPVIDAILCLQTENRGGRTKGTLYTWDGANWVSYVPPGGAGLASLNGLTGGTQTFGNDTNVTISSAGTAHTLGWAGQLSIARGGTSASSASGARTALGLVIGTDVQAFSDNLSALASEVSNGLWKITGAGTGDVAVAADIVALFNSGTCSGFLKSDGTCDSGTISEIDPVVGATTGIVKSNGSGTISAAVAGTDYVAPDAELTALAGLVSAANKLPYFTGSGTAALADLSVFGRSLIDDADAATARTTLGLGLMAVQDPTTVAITGGSITGITDLAVADGGTGASTAAGARTNLGLVIGTNVQAFDAELSALAGLASAADQLPYFTGSGTAATTTLTTFARSFLDDANAAAVRTTLGLVVGTDVQAQDAELSALAGLTSAANKLPYFTGSGTAALTDLSAFMRTVLDDADAATARTTLGAQTLDTELTAIAGLTSAADKVPYFTGAGTASVADFTSYGRLIIATANEAAFKALVNLENVDIVAAIEAATALDLTGVTLDIVPRVVTVATLPASPSNGQEVTVTGVASTNPEIGGGSVVMRAQWNAAIGHWIPAVPIGGSTTTLQQAKDNDATINNAVDPTTAVRVGNGVIYWADYCDSSNNCHRVTTDAAGTIIESDNVIEIGTNKNLIIRDKESLTDMWTIDPDAASPNAMYQIASGYRPLKSIDWDAGSINVDGTNCVVPTEQALNSSEKTWAFSCADSNSSIFSGKIRMPKAWDGGTVTFTLSLFHGTTESITFAGDFSAQCRGTGDAINSTYGTAVAADVSITTANQIAEATTAAVTPNGSCAGGKFLLWRYVVDAANFSANAANSKVIDVTMKYNTSSLSD